ncbi:MAG: class I SAM-dependent methyltransferase [Candidatus Poribacteria bacterium]|nr:class I SAM-dependent methyltransferase [Candidatus Poribacteria bacterium]
MERIVEQEVMDTAEAAEAYDAMGHGEVDQAFVDRVITLGANKGHFLDVGTGPAQIPIILAQLCPDIHITAIDLSQEMLKIAKRHIHDAGLTDRITLEHVDAKTLPYPDNTFDGLISNSIVHHIHDALTALQEMGRVVKPNVPVLIRDLIRPDTPADAQAFVDQYAANDTPHQQKLYYDSFLAAFTLAEVKQMLLQTDLSNAVVVQSTDRHWSIEHAV